MAFTTRRGRPPKVPSEATDIGTPELRFKHAHGLTMEPIDLCLDRQAITIAQHWCGLHLRWLYTLRYGAPNLTTRYDTDTATIQKSSDDPDWRRQREAEYHEAAALLHIRQHYEPVMRLCVYNEMPGFMHPRLREQAWTKPLLASRLQSAHQQLCAGLSLLVVHWKRH